MARILSPFIIALVLTGCASSYTPPTSGPISKLTIPKRPTETLLALKNNDGCAEMSRAIDTRAVNTVDIPAGENFFIRIEETAGNYFCNINMFFKPEEGHHYNLQYSWIEHSCIARISDNIEGIMIPIKLSRPIFDGWWMTGGKLCDHQPNNQVKSIN